MVSTLLLHRLQLECEDFLAECQAGFRQHRSTQDQILILSEIIAFVQEMGQARASTSTTDQNKTLASVAFLDYIATFDSVDHAFLDEALKLADASDKTCSILRVRAKGKGGTIAFSDPAHDTS